MTTIIEAEAVDEQGRIGSVRIEDGLRFGGTFEGGVSLFAKVTAAGDNADRFVLDDFGWTEQLEAAGGESLALPRPVWLALVAIIESSFDAGVRWASDEAARIAGFLLTDGSNGMSVDLEGDLVAGIPVGVRMAQRSQGVKYFADLAEPIVEG